MASARIRAKSAVGAKSMAKRKAGKTYTVTKVNLVKRAKTKKGMNTYQVLKRKKK